METLSEHAAEVMTPVAMMQLIVVLAVSQAMDIGLQFPMMEPVAMASHARAVRLVIVVPSSSSVGTKRLSARLDVILNLAVAMHRPHPL